VDKAAQDFQKIRQFLNETETGKIISDEELHLFCKNTNNLKVTKVISLEDELAEFKAPNEDFYEELHDSESCALWYLLLRCIEDFRQSQGYYAGMRDHNPDSHVAQRDKT